MIHFGIIGFGNIGTRHAKHIHAHSNASLAAVCDTNTVRRSLLKNSATPFFDSYKALIQESSIDVVNVCTPNYLHAEHTIAALEAGKHVVCEKPMALSTDECDAMIHAAEQNDRALFVVKQNRYNPPVAVVKDLIENGTLGKVIQVSINCFWNRNEAYYLNSDWRGSKRKDGGCLFTQCSHFIDILYFLAGDCTAISGILNNVLHQKTVEFEDSGTFILESKRGAIVNLNLSTCSFAQNMEGSITLLCEKGTVKIGGQYLNRIEYQCINEHVIPPLPQGNGCNDYGAYKGSMSNHDKVIQNVVDTLNGLDQIATNGTQGKTIIRIIEDMYASVRTPVAST